MKYIKKFNETYINIPGGFNDKDLMFKEFEDVFGFHLHSLTDRLLEWEDKGFNFHLSVVVWVKVESNIKYSLNITHEFPDKSINISSYTNQLCRYRTDAEGLDDNIEVVEFLPIDTTDIVAACIVLHELFPNEMYLDTDSYVNVKNKEKDFHNGFQELIKSIERRFNLVEIPGSDVDLRGATTIGTIFKRSGD